MIILTKNNSGLTKDIRDLFPVWTIQHDSFSISFDSDLAPSAEVPEFQFPSVPAETTNRKQLFFPTLKENSGLTNKQNNGLK